MATTTGKKLTIDGYTFYFSGAPLDSPSFTGTPTAPTAASGTNTTQIATTEFVQSAVASGGVTVDSAMSSTSTNTVQNKVIKEYVESQLALRSAYVTPEMFGAKGNGASDDTEAFVTMLSGYKNVCLKKTYRITSSIDLPSNAHIFGNGVILDDRNGPFSAYEGLLQSTGENILIEELTIETNNNASAIANKCELYFENTTKVTVKNATIKNADGNYGVLFNSCNNSKVINSIVDGYNYAAISNINGGNDFIVDHCRILNCKASSGNAYAIMLNGYDHQLLEDTYGGKNLQATNNYFYSDNPFWECVDAHGGTDILVSGNVFKNAPCAICVFTDTTRRFYIKNANVSNNFIECADEHLANGCVCSGENLVVANNTILNGGNSAASTSALRITSVSHSHIHHNSIRNSIDKGIEVSGADNTIIESNIIDTVTKTTDSYSRCIFINNGSYSGLIVRKNVFTNAEVGIRFPQVFTNNDKYVRAYDNQFNISSIKETNVVSGSVPQFAQSVSSLTIAKVGDIVLNAGASATTTKGWIYTDSGWCELESYTPTVNLGSGTDYAALFSSAWSNLPIGISRIKFSLNGATHWGHAYKSSNTYGGIVSFCYTSPYNFTYSLIKGTWAQKQ